MIGLNSKELECYSHKDGYPTGHNGARWYKDGLPIGEGEKYQIYRTYKLVMFIRNV